MPESVQATHYPQNEYPGTGIGLATSRRVVEGQGGKIQVTSESGVGITFSFTLPVYSPEASHEARTAWH